MTKEIPKKFGTNVFINCPLDEEYKLLLQPMLFTLVYVGPFPRLASEKSDSLEQRIEKILRLIKECKYSIHDLSRLKSAKANEFARSLEKSGDQIIVSRKEPVRTHGCIGLDLNWIKHPEMLREFVEKYGVTRPYKIRLRLGPKLEAAEYRGAYTVNDQISVNKSTEIQNREFYEDEAMRSFDPSYRELPVYFTEDSSIYVETTLHPWECIYPRVDAADCEQVRSTVDSFFVSYPEVTIDKSFSWMDL